MRFSYIKYDHEHTELQESAKTRFEEMEKMIEALPKGRATSLALTKLEECYMWVGKALRDSQIYNSGAKHVSERSNS